MSSRDIVDRLVQSKMRGNPTAVSPGHLDRIIWNEIKGDPKLLEAFAADATHLAYSRITDREREPSPPRREPPPHREPTPHREPPPPPEVIDKHVSNLRRVFDATVWPNGKPLLKATVREVGNFSAWGQAILTCSKLKCAKPDDEIGKYMTADDCYKLRTWGK